MSLERHKTHLRGIKLNGFTTWRSGLLFSKTPHFWSTLRYSCTGVPAPASPFLRALEPFSALAPDFCSRTHRWIHIHRHVPFPNTIQWSLFLSGHPHRLLNTLSPHASKLPIFFLCDTLTSIVTRAKSFVHGPSLLGMLVWVLVCHPFVHVGCHVIWWASPLWISLPS